MNQSIFWINRRLTDFGFFPEFEDRKKYFKALKNHLGANKSERFLNKIDSLINESHSFRKNTLEENVCKLIGADQKLLKIVYSTAINTSVLILDYMMDIIDEMRLNPKHIIDFGGANGWSLQIIKEFLEEEIKLSLIEYNKTWGSVSESIICKHESYSNAVIEEKADLGITILGSPDYSFEKLVECADRNLSEDSIFIVSLRIPSDQLFIYFLKLVEKYGFFIDSKFSKYIKIQTDSFSEEFPIMVFRRHKETGGTIINSLKSLNRN